MVDTSSVDLLNLIGKDTPLKKATANEYEGPCPFCGGEDRFRVWPNENPARFWCRQCGQKGDAIEYVQLVERVGFQDALNHLGLSSTIALPVRKSRSYKPLLKMNKLRNDYPALTNSEWQKAAVNFCGKAVDSLHSSEGEKAYNYLVQDRLLAPDVIERMQIGYNAKRLFAKWGTEQVWLQNGIVIPWWIQGNIWKVKFRAMPNQNAQRFIAATGSANGLYNVDTIKLRSVVVLVEGEIDALTILSHVTPQLPHVVALATGSTSGARVTRWITQISLADTILLAFDNDGGQGETASKYWQSVLGNKAKRLLPTRKDVNQMAQEGDDLLSWVTSAMPNIAV